MLAEGKAYISTCHSVLSSFKEIRRSLPLGIFVHADQIHLAVEQDVHAVIKVEAVVRDCWKICACNGGAPGS